MCIESQSSIGSVAAGLQAAAWIAAAGGLIVTILKFLSELREGRRQRERDLRWRQAEAGKSLNDEMQEDQRAWAAMRCWIMATGRSVSQTWE